MTAKKKLQSGIALENAKTSSNMTWYSTCWDSL